MVRGRFVRFVKAMRASEFLLMVREAFLLLGRQDAEFLLLGIGDLVWGHGGQIVVVGEIWEGFLAAETPSETVVVGDEAHVVGVDCAEGGQAVTDYGEERDEDVVDYVNNVVAAAADGDPACARG
jgi:hypothetical protein